MDIKPILFNTDMVRAILEGRKTVTRRVVKPQPKRVYLLDKWLKEDKQGRFSPLVLPYRPGDILYVRETWCRQPSKEYPFVYRASVQTPDAWRGSWHPSIHMPKEAARIFLRVTDVRVERLQDITDEQAKAEGANWKDGHNIGFEEKMRRSSINRFAEIWDGTIKPADRAFYGWAANPWVWVIEFVRISREEALNEQS